MDVNTEEILKEVDKIGEYISDKLQVPANMAMEIIMKQVKFDFAVCIFWIIFMFFISMVISIITFRVSKTEWYKREMEEGLDYVEVESITIIFLWILKIASWISTIIILGVNVFKMLQIYINPHWYAITMILEATSKK